MIRAAAVLAAAILAAPAAHGQTAAPDSENGRYSFNQVAEGLLRLDGRTGQVSLCNKRTVGWSCQSVPDERTALEAEIGRLQSETASLKKELISRGIALPGGIKSSERAPEKSDEPALKLPSDADMERVMGFLEKVWRRLIDVVQSMQKEKG
jgi:hypothetical protein